MQFTSLPHSSQNSVGGLVFTNDTGNGMANGQIFREIP